MAESLLHDCIDTYLKLFPELMEKTLSDKNEPMGILHSVVKNGTQGATKPNHAGLPRVRVKRSSS